MSTTLFIGTTPIDFNLFCNHGDSLTLISEIQTPEYLGHKSGSSIFTEIDKLLFSG